MKYLIVITIFILWGCEVNPELQRGPDTVMAWQEAGLITSGEGSGIEQIVRHEGTDQLICRTTAGDLYIGDRVSLNWNQELVNGSSLDVFSMDLSGDTLFVTTKWDEIWAFSINEKSWHNLTPVEGTWHDTRNYRKIWCIKKAIDNYLYLHMSVYYKDSLGQVIDKYDSGPKVFRYRANTWERVDKNWNQHATSIAFHEVESGLYLTTFENGLWRFNGTDGWYQIPGTEQFSTAPLIPGIRLRSLTTHNNETIVGTLGGNVWKLHGDDSWKELTTCLTGPHVDSLTIHDYPTFSALNLTSYNGILFHGNGRFYYSEVDSMWKNMTLNSNDTLYYQDAGDRVSTFSYCLMPSFVAVGDTLYGGLADALHKESGVYYLDLNNCGWYRHYKETGELK